MKRRERVANFLIIGRGILSSDQRVFASRSSSREEGGYVLYTLFAWPQHCSMKFSSQWNFGKKITAWIPWARQCFSSNDSVSEKSGWLYRIRWQQHRALVSPGLHLNPLHSTHTFDMSPNPRSSRIMAMPLNTPRNFLSG